jgi:hypothetical protein
MVSMLRWLLALLSLALIAAGGAFVVAGRTTPPSVVIDQPTGPVGQRGTCPAAR